MKSSVGFVGLKLDSTFLVLRKNLFLCGAYIPPENSKNVVSQNTEYFEILGDAVSRYSEQGQILIMGDLNARIGLGNTQQVNILVLDNILPQGQPQLANRSSCDPKVNKYGKN